MKRFGFLLFACCVVAGMLMVTISCEDDDEPTGTSIIQGNIDSFEVAGLYYVPAGRQNLWARVVSGLSDAIVPPAYAGQAGVIVYLDGPVSRVGETDDAGAFIFTGLPAGDYQLRFGYNGQEAAYSGEISLQDDQQAELANITISGGNVIIGNITVVDLNESGEPASTDSSAGSTQDQTDTTSDAPMLYVENRTRSYGPITLSATGVQAHMASDGDIVVSFAYSFSDLRTNAEETVQVQVVASNGDGFELLEMLYSGPAGGTEIGGTTTVRVPYSYHIVSATGMGHGSVWVDAMWSAPIDELGGGIGIWVTPLLYAYF